MEARSDGARVLVAARRDVEPITPEEAVELAGQLLEAAREAADTREAKAGQAEAEAQVAVEQAVEAGVRLSKAIARVRAGGEEGL